MKDPVSSRSVFVTRNDNDETIVMVSQPSDCLLLQRHHVQDSEVKSLAVEFNVKPIEQSDKPSDQQQFPDTWKKAIYHILNTYRPTFCYLYTGHYQTGVANGHEVQTMDGTSYGAYWNESQSLLSIRE